MLMSSTTVGEFGRGDTSIQITGLKPGNYYGIRVVATDDANLTSIGPIIRLRTLALSQTNNEGILDSEKGSDEAEAAAVHATSAPFEIAPSSPAIREPSAAQHQAKRAASGRRNSPATSGGEQGNSYAGQSGSSDEDESPETIQRLTTKLELLRAEKERVDREIQEDEQESKRHLAELNKERDRLRQEYREKEEASSELRKHGNYLDKLNRTAQSKRAAKEKQLQQKKADRQKFKDDIARWKKETVEMARDTEEMVKEEADVIGAKNTEVEDARKTIAKDLATIKSLEEDIRVKGIQIKEMEREQEKMNSEGSSEREQARIETENDQAWEAKWQTLQAQFNSLWQLVSQAELEKQRAEEHLSWWTDRRTRNPEQFVQMPSLDFPQQLQRNRSRRSRQPNSRASTNSSLPSTYQGGSPAFNNPSLIAPPFSNASPFFNSNNGMTLSSVADQNGIPQNEVEALIAGGPMSPAADNLLPSNLFRDEDISNQLFSKTIGPEYPSNMNPDVSLGHGVSYSDAAAQGPQTPGSAGSRAGSVLSSPHESLQNLHSYQSRPDPFIESQQHSLSSTTAPLHPSIAADSNPLASNRLANLFSFKSQRGKPGTQDPPLLGTLKQGQSQSFPRNLEEGLDLNTSRRRRGSYGNWANPMAGLLNRNAGPPEDTGIITARTGSGRRSRLNMFGGKFDGHDPATFADQPSSSRPSSTYSYDQVLARPSSDSQRFGWPVPEGIPNRSSPLGANWSGGPWSRAPSRRPSVQHGSTSNLSLGSTPLDPEGFSKQSSDQAPIGTRPRSSQRPGTPTLNPAAPSFKTLFSRRDAGRTTKTGGRSAEKSKDKESEKGEAEDTDSITETSPQNPRLSRDAQSIATAASTTDSHDSFDRSTSGTPTEAFNSSGSTKETLIQKITRKSSSSKFNLNSWAKDRGLKSKPAGQPSTPTEHDEEASSDGLLGKSAESTSSTPQQEKAGRTSLSWPNIRRKSKKGDVSLTEATERSSEVGDDDDA